MASTPSRSRRRAKGRDFVLSLAPVRRAYNKGFDAPELRRIHRIISEHHHQLMGAWNAGMNVSDRRPQHRVRSVRVTDERLFVDLDDGRTISVPLEWYPRLRRGSAEQRANWRTVGAGWGLHWPDLDEDISVPALLQGKPSSEFEAARIRS